MEIEYFITLCELPLPQLKSFDHSLFETLRGIYQNFDEECAQRVKDIEKITNHDVKAVEYFIKEEFDKIGGCLDFGDSYLLDRVVHEFGMDRCIRALGTGGEDTIFALLGFCIFNERLGMCNAEEWFAGNFASILYPGADLRSQRISDALYLMGDEQFCCFRF